MLPPDHSANSLGEIPVQPTATGRPGWEQHNDVDAVVEEPEPLTEADVVLTGPNHHNYRAPPPG